MVVIHHAIPSVVKGHNAVWPNDNNDNNTVAAVALALHVAGLGNIWPLLSLGLC